MKDIDLINKIYKISDKHNVILKGHITISRNTNVILFAHYCKSTLFYKDFFNVSKDVLNVNKMANKNLKEAKKIIKNAGYKKVWAHYCKSTLFYKDFFNVSKDVLNVNKMANKNLKEAKKIIKNAGYKKVWTKGIFSVYGDLRPLAVEANFGKWGNNGIIVNDKYGSDFLISAIFYK